MFQTRYTRQSFFSMQPISSTLLLYLIWRFCKPFNHNLFKKITKKSVFLCIRLHQIGIFLNFLKTSSAFPYFELVRYLKQNLINICVCAMRKSKTKFESDVNLAFSFLNQEYLKHSDFRFPGHVFFRTVMTKHRMKRDLSFTAMHFPSAKDTVLSPSLRFLTMKCRLL